MEKIVVFVSFSTLIVTQRRQRGEGKAMAAKKTKTDKKTDSKTTHEKRFEFLCLYSETGNVTESAKKAGLNRQHLYEFRDSNPEFSKAWEECRKLAGEALRDEAFRRAKEGVEEPVFFKGRKVGTVRKYSDQLLALLLKASFPDEFAERKKAEVTTPEPITIRLAMPPGFAAEEPENAAAPQ
jgi:hypothetical protein